MNKLSLPEKITLWVALILIIIVYIIPIYILATQ